MKNYTDLEQSKRLIDILPVESADIILILENSELTSYPIMRNYSEFYNYLRKFEFEEEHIKRMYIPAWSLSALLSVLLYPHLEQNYKGKWCCRTEYADTTYLWEADNPIDACYEMILKLHELKML